MAAMDWDAEAKAAANYVLDEMFETHRGVIDWGDEPVTVAFGNDGYGTDERPRREVAALRMALKIAGLTELGFGLSDDEEQYTWAMVINTTDETTVRRSLCDAAAIGFGWSKKFHPGLAESKVLRSDSGPMPSLD